MSDTEPPTLFDTAEGERRRDQGIADVIAHADAAPRSARACFIEAIQRHAESGLPFTADDIQADLPEDVEPPHSPNLLPALMQGASKRGLIRMHGLAHSARPSRHAGRVCVWIGRNHDGAF